MGEIIMEINVNKSVSGSLVAIIRSIFRFERSFAIKLTFFNGVNNKLKMDERHSSV